MFADDVTLYATGNDVSHIQSTLQGDLECVLTWFRKNRLFVNPSKSSCVLVGTPQRTKHQSLLIKINGIILEQVDSPGNLNHFRANLETNCNSFYFSKVLFYEVPRMTY